MTKIGECFAHGKYEKVATYSYCCPFCAIEAEDKAFDAAMHNLDLQDEAGETEEAFWSMEL
jgi:hypothetical protein